MAGLGDSFAYVFNRTALGLGVLAGCWLVYEGVVGGHGFDYLWRAAVIFFVLIPLYFWLHARVDAP